MQHYSWVQVMEQRTDYLVLLLLICCSSSTIEARKHLKYSISDTNGNYIGSPYYVPPYEDVMGPSSSPNKQEPLYCVYPPLTPLAPSTTFPTPTPPPPFISTTPPTPTPTPPHCMSPSSSPNPSPSPPIFTPGPPSCGPSPPEFVPGPPTFLPPVVYPPPTAPPPPPPCQGTGPGLWCVAKPTVPELIIQEAMTYACGSGADCDMIQPNGACYEPDTLIAHASYAFNSYWQRTKAAGGTCDFGGTATLVTKDPSYDGCQFGYMS